MTDEPTAVNALVNASTTAIAAASLRLWRQVVFLFFRHHFWKRLMVHVGIVRVFLAFGVRLRKRT